MALLDGRAWTAVRWITGFGTGPAVAVAVPGQRTPSVSIPVRQAARSIQLLDAPPRAELAPERVTDGLGGDVAAT